MNTKNKFEKIMVQKDGELINIQDLDQKDYEYFLEFIHAISIAYKTVIESKRRS